MLNEIKKHQELKMITVLIHRIEADYLFQYRACFAITRVHNRSSNDFYCTKTFLINHLHVHVFRTLVRQPSTSEYCC